MTSSWSTTTTVLAISCIKMLFLHSYRSTDFEVHRNWLAITHSLPLSRWYLDGTSEWTLDYPPLFAWFECGLSQVAAFFDPKMLIVANLNYASDATVLFQRVSVIFGDLFLAYGVKTCHDAAASNQKMSYSSSSGTALMALVLANAGLLIVDHIHFQYNGFLFGVALHSIGCLMQERFLLSGFWFAVLLNLKHIYLYCAPAYFIYLLRHYCLSSFKAGIGFSAAAAFSSLRRLASLGSIVAAVFIVSFGPFVYHGQLADVARRLFPFKRGLCHAYWAPNFWALYNMADKALAVGGHRLGLISRTNQTTASMTGGLVREFDHEVLPSVKPLATFVLVACAMAPILIKLWRMDRGSSVQFLRSIVLCNFASFLFGWHVHEKAILLVIVPLTVLGFLDKRDASIHLLLSCTGHVSLFPLLFRQEEYCLKVLILLFYTFAYLRWMTSYYSIKGFQTILTFPEYVLLLGLCFPVLGELLLIPSMPLLQKYSFLPLLLYSVYCSMCLAYCWVKLYRLFLQAENVTKVKTK